MDRTSWLDTAVSGIRFGPDRRAVRAELEGHIEDKTADLQRIFPDIPESEARDRALAGMGDAEELKISLSKIHKPWLGYSNSAYQELGVNLELSGEEGFYNYYATRYMIWANDAAKEALGVGFTGDGPDVSSCFLMNLLFAQLGWTGDAWAQATADIWREIPVLTDVGRYVRNGVLTAELDPEGQESLQRYLGLQYYYSTHFQYK